MVTRRLWFGGALFDGQSANKKPVRIELISQHISLWQKIALQKLKEELKIILGNYRFLSAPTPNGKK